MPIHAPVLLLLSEVAEVIAVLVDDLIIATLGRALGGFEDIFSSAGPNSSQAKIHKHETKIRTLQEMFLNKASK
jgi:hypothetical protein